MKSYKHKGSDFILRTNNDTNTLDMYDCEDRMICKGVPQSMVILGNDWEEIKEEDWIKQVEKEMQLSDYTNSFVREAINKHLPRITDDMIEEMRKELGNGFERDWKYTIKQNLPKDLLANPE